MRRRKFGHGGKREAEPDDLLEVTGIAREQRFTPGQDLCREGELGDDVFLLVKGEVRVYTGGGDSQFSANVGLLLVVLGLPVYFAWQRWARRSTEGSQ